MLRPVEIQPSTTLLEIQPLKRFAKRHAEQMTVMINLQTPVAVTAQFLITTVMTVLLQLII